MSTYLEVHMNTCEDFGVGLRAIGVGPNLTARNGLTTFSQNKNHVVGGAGSSTREHNLHGPRAEVTTTAFGCAVHNETVA